MSTANTSRVYYNKLKRKDPKRFRKLSYRSWASSQRQKWQQRQDIKRERLTNLQNIQSQAENGTIYYKIGLSKEVRKTTPEKFVKIRQKELSRAKILTRERYEFQLKANAQVSGGRVKIVKVPGQPTKYYNLSTKKGVTEYNKFVLDYNVRQHVEKLKQEVIHKKIEKQNKGSFTLAAQAKYYHGKYKAETFSMFGVAPYKQVPKIKATKPIPSKVSFLDTDTYDEVYGFGEFDKSKPPITQRETIKHSGGQFKEIGLTLAEGSGKLLSLRQWDSKTLREEKTIGKYLDVVMHRPPTIGKRKVFGFEMEYMKDFQKEGPPYFGIEWKDSDVETTLKTAATAPFFMIPGVAGAAAIYGSARLGTGLRTYNPSLVTEGAILTAPYLFGKGFKLIKGGSTKIKTKIVDYRFKTKLSKIESKYGKFKLPSFKTERVFVESPFLEKGIKSLPAKGESPIQFIETIRKPAGYDIISDKIIRTQVDPLVPIKTPTIRQTTITGTQGVESFTKYEVVGTITSHTKLGLRDSHLWDLTKFKGKSTSQRTIEGEGFTFKQDRFIKLEGSTTSSIKLPEFQRNLLDYKAIEFKTPKYGQKLITGDLLKINYNTFKGSKSLWKHKGGSIRPQKLKFESEIITGKKKIYSGKLFGERWKVPERYKSPFRDLEIISEGKLKLKLKTKPGLKFDNLLKSKTRPSLIFTPDMEHDLFTKGGLEYQYDTKIKIKSPELKPKSKQKQKQKQKLKLFYELKFDNKFEFIDKLPPPPPIKFSTKQPPPPPPPIEPTIKIDFDLKRGFKKKNKTKKKKKSKRKYKYTATFEAAFEKQFKKVGVSGQIFTGIERRSLLI